MKRPHTADASRATVPQRRPSVPGNHSQPSALGSWIFASPMRRTRMTSVRKSGPAAATTQPFCQSPCALLCPRVSAAALVNAAFAIEDVASGHACSFRVGPRIDAALLKAELTDSQSMKWLVLDTPAPVASTTCRRSGSCYCVSVPRFSLSPCAPGGGGGGGRGGEARARGARP